jgi:hypothetical protein
MSESGPDIFCGGAPTTIVLELLRDRFDVDLFRGLRGRQDKKQWAKCIAVYPDPL